MRGNPDINYDPRTAAGRRFGGGASPLTSAPPNPTTSSPPPIDDSRYYKIGKNSVPKAPRSAAGVAGKLGASAGILTAPLSVSAMRDASEAGEHGQAALHAADAIAALGLATPAAPAAALYLGGRGLYEGGKYLHSLYNEPDQRITEGLSPTGLPLNVTPRDTPRGPTPTPRAPEVDTAAGASPGDADQALANEQARATQGFRDRRAYNVMAGRALQAGDDESRVGILRENFTGDASKLPGINQAVGKGRRYTVNNEAFARESNYVDENGRPVNSYSDTRQYKEGALRAYGENMSQIKQAQAHALAGDRNRAYALAMGNPDAEAAVADALQLGNLQRKAQAGNKDAIAALQQRQTHDLNMYKTNLEARDRAARLGFEQNKAIAELGMKGQELGLRREDLGLKRDQFGYEMGKDRRDFTAGQADKRDARFDKNTTVYAYDKEGKTFEDQVKSSQLREMISATHGADWDRMSPQQQRTAADTAKYRMVLRDIANEIAGQPFLIGERGAMRQAPTPSTGPRESRWADAFAGPMNVRSVMNLKFNPFVKNQVVEVQNEAGETIPIPLRLIKERAGAYGLRDFDPRNFKGQ